MFLKFVSINRSFPYKLNLLIWSTLKLTNEMTYIQPPDIAADTPIKAITSGITSGKRKPQ